VCSFFIHFLATLNGGKVDRTNSLLTDMLYALEENRMEDFMERLKVLFKGIAYPLIDNKEKYNHSIFYTVVRMMGYHIEVEVLTIDGRIDAVLFTEQVIYVAEFKVGNGQKAIDQIRAKGYHQKYADDPRQKMLWGIDFDVEQKSIAEYRLEVA